MSLDESITNKHPGDTIRSADWNALASETIRLGDTKLDRGLIGVRMLRGESWDNETQSGDWQPVIKETLEFGNSSSLLLVAHGQGFSDTPGLALDVVIMANGNILGRDDRFDLAWGMGILQPNLDGSSSGWTQIVAVAEYQVSRGKENEFALAMRCRRPEGVKDGSVKFSAPSLWLIQLGAG